MNIKKALFAAVLALGCLGATAQQETKSIEVFKPHWYLQLQGGAQYTEGERDFKDLISPNVQLAVGYNFNKVIGARLAVNAWQSKAGSVIDGNEYAWKWKYVAPMVDVTFNLSNAICGYNPTRLVNVGVFAGLGANIAFDNDEAVKVNNTLHTTYQGLMPNYDQWLRYIWDGTTTRFTGHVGASVDFRISDAVSLGIEGQFNMLNDHYNSKQAPNPDFYYNLLGGVKINLGKTHQSKTIEIPTKTIERVIERPVTQPNVERPQRPVQTQQPVKEPLRREVFFPVIRSVNIPADQMGKVEDVANYLKKYPEAKVTVTGYADKNTGNPTINQGYSEKRAQAVVDVLTGTYGIDASRIIKVAKGDTEQPFSNNDSNRVSICIAE
ncbi:MAG: OmpA family protein [Bacteroidaceae bacterium]|nr:OmpA family protein [Bacteroidaceae bacterium]